MLIIIVIVRAARPDNVIEWEPKVHWPPLGPYTTDLCEKYTNFNYTQPDISMLHEFGIHEDWALSEIRIF